jgi:hypothetical protein
MSTILDALRKIEGEQRARTTDARARLLLAPALPRSRHSRSRHLPGVISIGLALSGFAAWIGFVLWRSPSHPAEEQIARAPVSDATPPVPTQVSTAAATPLPATLPAVETPSRPTLSAPFVSNSNPSPPSEDAYELYTDGAFPTVQRSPFVTASPTRETALPPQPPMPSSPADRKERQPVFLTGTDLQGYHSGESVAALPPGQETTSGTSSVSTTAPPNKSPDGGQTRSTSPLLDPIPANTSLSFLQWSPEPSKRLAFIKVNGGPLTLVQEGDTVSGFTVVEIRRDAVELRSGTANFTLRTK